MARCGACGLAIRKGQPISLRDVFVIHRACQDIPESVYAARINTTPSPAQEAHYKILQAEVSALRQDRDLLQRRLDTALHERDAARSTSRGSESVFQRTLERATAAEREVRNLKGLLAVAERALRTPRHSTDLEGMALGLAIGRGIWGFARLVARYTLDTLDDAQARYRLLELG